MRQTFRFQLAAAIALVVGGQSHAQIVNGSFESGDFAGWVTVDLNSPFFPMLVGPAGVSPGFGFFLSDPTDGVFAALNGWDGDGPGGPPEAIQIAQDLVLPAGAAEVLFDYRAAWDTTFGATLPREFRVDIEPFGGGAFMQRDLLLVADPGTTVLDTGNLLGVVDVSSFGGTPIRLSFECTVPQTFTGPAFFQLDNVQLTVIPVADRTLIIKQGACPAPINPGSNGVTKMVLVGDEDFDVSEVVLCSLELSRCDGIGGTLTPDDGPGPGFKIIDLNRPNDGEVGCDSDQVPCACNEDQSSDGIDDLRIRFSTSEMASALMLAGEPAGSVITLFLTGELTDGTQFIAGDCIQIVGAPAAPPALLIVEASGQDVWVDVTPGEEAIGGGNFTSFLRVFPQGTIVELSAPETHLGSVFTGWVVNGQPRPYLSPTTVIVVDQEVTTAVVHYRPLHFRGIE